MPTAENYEDYPILYAQGNYALAMDHAARYMAWLLAYDPRSMADGGSSIDPGDLQARIEACQKFIQMLQPMVNGLGQPRMIPTVRADPYGRWRGQNR